MENIRSLYRKGSPDYFAVLYLDAATDIDFALMEKETDFQAVHELQEILEQYHINDDNISASQGYPFDYVTLYHAFSKTSEKTFRDIYDMDLEIQLLSQELRDIRMLSREKLEMLKRFCLEARREYCAYRETGIHRLVA